MAEFNTVHIVSLENASRFFSGAPVKICHIPVNFFMTIAKIFHNPSKVSYVDLSSKVSVSCLRCASFCSSCSFAARLAASLFSRSFAIQI